MISPKREQELLQIKDANRLFEMLCKELGIEESEVIPLNLTTPKLAKHILSLSKQRRVDDKIDEFGFRECMNREIRKRK